ncbi:MAG: hypothetical protein PHC75_10600, partial [Burkholderiales bacterium]|nr:hypothetical protein [Burkholderiales bacterium]
MKVKKIVCTLSLISLFGGVGSLVSGCHNGKTAASTVQQSPTDQVIFLNSNFVEQGNLKNGVVYDLFVINEDDGDILVKGMPFQCNSLNVEAGCELKIPMSKSNSRLSFLIYKDNEFIAANSMSQSAISAGLDNIYFNENTTGEYIFASMMNMYGILGEQKSARSMIRAIFAYDPNNSIDFNVKLFLFYKKLQKKYGADTIYHIMDVLYPVDDINLDSSLLQSEKALKSRSISGHLTMSSRSTGGVTTKDAKDDIEKILGCSGLVADGDGSYSCLKKKGSEADGTFDQYDKYSKEYIQNAIVGAKTEDQEYKKILQSSMTQDEKNAAIKKQREENYKQAATMITQLTPVAKQLSNIIAKELKVKVSAETQSTIGYLKVAVTIVGVVGNVWLPGVSSALAALTNSMLDGFFGDNEKSANTNPNARVEAILNIISGKLDTVNGNLNTLVEKI